MTRDGQSCRLHLKPLSTALGRFATSIERLHIHTHITGDLHGEGVGGGSMVCVHGMGAYCTHDRIHTSCAVCIVSGQGTV